MKLLVDDIYVCYKIFGTDFSKMFITARQRSQGNQNTYTPTSSDITENNNNNKNKPLKLNRSQTICCGDNNTYFNNKPLETLIKNSNFDDLELGLEIGQLKFEDNNLDTTTPHVFGEINDNPYATPKIVKLMRNVSSLL